MINWSIKGSGQKIYWSIGIRLDGIVKNTRFRLDGILSIVPFPSNTLPLHFLHSLPCFPLSPPLYPFLFTIINPILPILPYYFSLPLLLYSPFPLATIKFLLLENNETGFKKKKLRINLYIMISVRNKKGSETGDKNQVISS